MNRRYLFLISLSLGLCLAPLFGQNRKPERRRDPEQHQVRPPRAAVMRQIPVLRTIVNWQREFQKQCISSLRRFKTNPSALQVFLLLGMALVYGAVHALGPGHGKIVLSACVIGNRYSLKSALKGSLLFSLVHNGIPVILYIVFLLILRVLKYRHTPLLTAHMYRISGILLALLGTVWLISLWVKKQHHPPDQEPGRWQRLSLPLACAAAGLVPCPGTLLILFFAGTLGVPAIGFGMAGAFFTGMLLTLSIFALLVTSGRNYVVAQYKIRPLITILRILGPVFLIVVGLYMATL